MPSTPQVLAFGDFRFDLTTRELSLAKIDGSPTPVPLGSRAADLLHLFLQRPGDLVTKAEIMQAVWPNSVVEDSNLSVQISTLRRVLDESLPTSAIQTVPGRGYRFALPVTEAPDVQISGAKGFGSDPLKPDAAGSGTSASGLARAGWPARRLLIGGAMLVALLAGAALVLFWQRFSASQVAEMPDFCSNGLVWREATPGDHVCVTPKFRFMVRKKEVGPPSLQSPGADSAPLPSMGVRVEGVALYGWDYALDNNTPDVESCQDACRNDRRCGAWTYEPRGPQRRVALRWLKENHVPQPARNPCCVSGIERPLDGTTKQNEAATLPLRAGRSVP